MAESDAYPTTDPRYWAVYKALELIAAGTPVRGTPKWIGDRVPDHTAKPLKATIELLAPQLKVRIMGHRHYVSETAPIHLAKGIRSLATPCMYEASFPSRRELAVRLVTAFDDGHIEAIGANTIGVVHHGTRVETNIDDWRLIPIIQNQLSRRGWVVHELCWKPIPDGVTVVRLGIKNCKTPSIAVQGRTPLEALLMAACEALEQQKKKSLTKATA